MYDVKQFASDKILHHLKEVIRWKNGFNPYAITTEIDPTNVCNHKCPGCAGWLSDKVDNSSLSSGEMRKAIKEIKHLGGKAVTFTGGGEPLVNRWTENAIDYAKYTGLDIGLVTNGSLLNRTNNNALVNNCTWIRVSLDAGTESMHRYTHGVKDFSLVVENIKSLVKAKEKTSSNCTIGIGYLTGMRTNHYSDMMDFVDLAIELEVDYAQFRPYHTAAKKDLTKLNIPLNFENFVNKGTDKTKILYSKHKYDCIIENRLRPEYDVCYGHQFATVITATGDMTLCCHTRGLEAFTLGNVKIESIKDIWFGKRRRRAIEKINLDKCPALCRANTFNYILYEIAKKKEHVNFL